MVHNLFLLLFDCVAARYMCTLPSPSSVRGRERESLFQFDCCILLSLLLSLLPLLLLLLVGFSFFNLALLCCYAINAFTYMLIATAAHIRHYERQRSTYFRSGRPMMMMLLMVVPILFVIFFFGV